MISKLFPFNCYHAYFQISSVRNTFFSPIQVTLYTCGNWPNFSAFLPHIQLDVKTPCSEKHEENYGISTLEKLYQDPESLTEELFPGGEQKALRRLDQHMARKVLMSFGSLLDYWYMSNDKWVEDEKTISLLTHWSVLRLKVHTLIPDFHVNHSLM